MLPKAPIQYPSVPLTHALRQAEEQAEDEAWRAEQARRAGIVAEERARLLRGAVHLRDYLPAEDARQMAALMSAT